MISQVEDIGQVSNIEQLATAYKRTTTCELDYRAVALLDCCACAS